MKNPFIRGLRAQGLTLIIGAAFFSFSAFANAAEVQIFSNEQRQENANSLILDNDNTGGNITLQFGASLNKQLYWDSSGEQFIFTDDLNVQGNVDIDGTITAGSGNIQITDATGNIDGSKIASDSIGDGSIDFGMGADQVGADDITMTDEFDNSTGTNVQDVVDDLDQAITNAVGNIAGSTGTTSNSYILDTDNTGGNVTLQFGTTLGESIYWNNAQTRFEFSDDIYVNGNIDLSGLVDGVDVSGLNTTVGTLGSTVTGIDTDLTTLEGTVTTLGSTVTGIDTDLTTLEGTVTTHGTDIGTINTILQGNKVQSIVVPMNTLTVGSDGSNNLADIYTGFDAVDKHEYYIVKTQQASLQDIDLKFKVKVPADFKDFTNANDVSFYYKNTGASASDSKIDILIEDDDGDDAFTAIDGQNLFNTSWTQYTDEFDGGSFNPVAGEYIYVTVKGYARNNSGIRSPYIGEIVINYNSKDVWAN